MKIYLSSIVIFFAIIICFSCNNNKVKYHIDVSELRPWCILEFDSLDRTPIQRIEMLKKLGFNSYSYNWRERHLEETIDEFKLANSNGIDITSTLVWLNAKRDSLGKLSPRNKKMFDNLGIVDKKPTIWLSFSDNFFKDKTQKESVEIATEMIRFVKLKVDSIGSELALYNHNGWFGNPYNQLEILNELKDDEISIVYNFHHAQNFISDYSDIIQKLMPYLSQVNINGMDKEKTKILDVGKGDFEFDMIKELIDNGFEGPWGILGHVKTDDVEAVLKRNLEGVKKFNELHQ